MRVKTSFKVAPGGISPATMYTHNPDEHEYSYQSD